MTFNAAAGRPTPNHPKHRKVDITIEYRDGTGSDDIIALDTAIADGMYKIKETEAVFCMIPLDRIACVTEEVID